MTRHEAAEARLALQPLLSKAAALRIRSASPEAANQRVTAAAAEVVAVIEKHLSTLVNV